MFSPAFMPLGYGQKTLSARITYSDGSTVNAVTTYDSLPMEAVNNGAGTDLQVGGTNAADSATVTKLSDKSYRVNIAGQTRDFQAIDNVIVHLSDQDDTLILVGGMAVDMTSLAGVERIDTSASTVESITTIDETTVDNQVGPTGTLLIKSSVEDVIEFLPGWTLEKPQLLDGRATAKLTADGKTVLLQSGKFTNPLNSLDTTFDGVVTARDALLVINHINQVSAGTTPTVEAYLDTNGNGVISALDVLLVINDINSRSAGEGEATAPEVVDASSVQSAPLTSEAEETARRRRLL